MSIWSKNITESAAFWGMVSGFFSNIIASLIDYLTSIDLPVYLDPILIGIIVSLITILSLSRKGSGSDKLSNYRNKLHENAPAVILKEVARTLVWPKIMVIIGFVTSSSLILFYAMPYHEAMGTSHMLLTSGEFILSLGYGLVLILGGIFVEVVTRYQNKNT
jgi:sodium/pantothenate symporter